MKYAAIALAFLLPATAFAATPNPAEYAVVVHVTSSRTVETHDGISQDLTATIDGRRVELEGAITHLDVLRTGDYNAKLIKQDEAHAYEYRWVYEFLFADGKTRSFAVVGESR